MKLNKYIDHTILKSDVRIKDIKILCKEAIDFSFTSVCINSHWVKICKKMLVDTDVDVCTVVGFPLGAMSTKAKVCEATKAVEDGADEIDMVINIGKLLDKDYDFVKNDIAKVKEAIGDKILKVIFENCLLSDEDIKKAVEISIEANANFIKTSTGFSNGGATFKDVKLMLDTAQDKVLVKASGGIRTIEDFKKYINMGVKRIGTSSGVKLVQNKESDTDY